jgi:class 3 adenylate cyclase
MVVVGDLLGSGEAQEHDIVGETPNLAARLQAVAEPNMIVIADATRRLLGNLSELRDLGPKDLKGIPGPVRAFAAATGEFCLGRRRERGTLLVADTDPFNVSLPDNVPDRIKRIGNETEYLLDANLFEHVDQGTRYRL